MNSKIYNCSLILMTIFIVIMSFFFYFLYFIDGVYYKQPLTEYGDLVIEKESYTAGEDIYASWYNCVGDLKRGKAEIKSSFVDGLVYNIPIRYAYVERDLGCSTLRLYVVTVPENLPAGEYHLEGLITYKINNVKDISYKRSSNNFIVY